MKTACLALSAALAFTGGAASADQLKLVCSNGMRDYLVVFDTGSKRFVINPDTSATVYKVASARQGEDGLVVRGQTAKGGPAFEAFFGDGAAITFLDPEPFQTDPCRHV